MASAESLVPTEDITRAILVLRGHRVLLDTELAALYGVTTKRFNEQVRRNAKRFPSDFMFQLTAEEISSLRSQFATLKLGRGQHRKYLPYVFTEHGAIMAAIILNSPRAVEMSVYVVLAFVQLCELLASNKELARRFAQLETRLDKKLSAHDEAIAALLSAIRRPPQCSPIPWHSRSSTPLTARRRSVGLRWAYRARASCPPWCILTRAQTPDMSKYGLFQRVQPRAGNVTNTRTNRDR